MRALDLSVLRARSMAYMLNGSSPIASARSSDLASRAYDNTFNTILGVYVFIVV